MTILDVLKERILELKNRILLSPNYAKIIDLIPDSETIDSYYQDTYTGKWLLKAGMAINQVPILDANRNLLVESPNYVEYELEIKVIDGAHEHITPIELTFLADSISINAYAVGSDHSCMIFIYYLFSTEIVGGEYEQFYNSDVVTAAFLTQIDCKPFSRFFINIENFVAGDSIKVRVIFSKQKKTKISDSIFSSAWDSITDVAPSKNALFDKINAMISDITYDENSWNGITTIAPSKNAVRDKIVIIDAHIADTTKHFLESSIHLNDLAEKSHINLTDKGSNTHSAIDTHIANTTNPHSVTKTQIGLSNVVNYEQIVKATPVLAGYMDLANYGLTLELVAGASLVAGDLCYQDTITPFRMKKAYNTSSPYCSNLLAIALESGSNGSTITFLIFGCYITSGLTSGAIYYVNSTAGGITATRPTTSTYIVRVIGYAISTTILFVNIDKTYIELV